MDKKYYKYFAAAYYAILALLEIVIFCTNDASFSVMIPTLAYLVITIMLLTDNPISLTVSFLALAIRITYDFDLIYGLIYGLELLAEWDVTFYFICQFALCLAVIVPLIVAGFQCGYAKRMGLIAAIAAAVRYIRMYGGYGFYFEFILWDLAPAAGAILLGLAYNSFSAKAAKPKIATVKTNHASTQGALEESNIEKIMRLKSFLDQGFITQEEFDEKKKQLLDL